jgi:hypothetical protein
MCRFTALGRSFAVVTHPHTLTGQGVGRSFGARRFLGGFGANDLDPCDVGVGIVIDFGFRFLVTAVGFGGILRACERVVVRMELVMGAGGSGNGGEGVSVPQEKLCLSCWVVNSLGG